MTAETELTSSKINELVQAKGMNLKEKDGLLIISKKYTFTEVYCRVSKNGEILRFGTNLQWSAILGIVVLGILIGLIAFAIYEYLKSEEFKKEIESMLKAKDDKIHLKSATEKSKEMASKPSWKKGMGIS